MMSIYISSQSIDNNLETEVCIVGAGPAGITLAREFINQRFRVLLVESGGIDFDEDTQSLCEAEVIGDQYPNLRETRLRQFGGTAHYWEAPVDYKRFGFRCLPLDEIDFEQRDWLPYSGWPFRRSDLDPFYQRAHQVCKLGPFTYTAEDWEAASTGRLPFNSERVVTMMSQYAPRSIFTHEYREEIQRSNNINILLHTNVVEIETDETAKIVTRLRVVCLQGKQFWIRAKVFILATGGIENARLLLLSRQVQKTGLGNQNDLVGRFFMERPIVSCGMLLPYNRNLLDQTGLYDIHVARGVPVMARIMLTEDLVRREKLLNNGAQLFPRPQPHQKAATNSLRALIAAIRHAKVSNDTVKHLRNVMHGSDYIAAAAFWSTIRCLPSLNRGDWSYLPYEKRRFSMFEVIYQIEQAPNPNNRIVLSNDLDCLGQNKAKIYWCLNDIDIQNVERVQAIWAEEFAKSGIGELQLHNEDGLKFEKPAMHHHMGTTRMHNDLKQGVVDADCKLHGVENLFLAGSSVFPTSGYANPTLTIIALALRLADRVKTFF